MNSYPNEQVAELDLRRYARAVWRAKKLILLSTLAAMGVAFAFLQLLPEASGGNGAAPLPPYRASLTVRVDSSPQIPANSALELLGLGNQANQGIQSHVDLMQSLNVLTRAAAALSGSGTAEQEATQPDQEGAVAGADESMAEDEAITADEIGRASCRERVC